MREQFEKFQLFYKFMKTEEQKEITKEAEISRDVKKLNVEESTSEKSLSLISAFWYSCPKYDFKT